MNKELKRAWVVAKINFNQMKIAYFLTILALMFSFIDLVGGYYFNWNYGGSEKISFANYSYLIVILAPIFIAGHHFERIMNLNGQKKDFFYGSLMNYSIIAGVVSILNLITYFTIDALLSFKYVFGNLMDVIGWMEHGIAFAFLQ
ncbi:hypothetical protein ACFSTH_18895 [Paenibacillus yanchengensis]|uniref:Uncharacterized protein n=1 Tax=Paenibacillus yanchengensis TaxID=2035833 RepID=A0ABW4YMB1_9BACL